MPRTITRRAVRSYRTLSPLPVPKKAIGGLLSAALVVGSRPQTLSGTLPYGARTFLPFVRLPSDFNISFLADLNVSLLKDGNKAAITQPTPKRYCIRLSSHLLVKTEANPQ